jgi:hypothetical protein
VLSFHPVLLLRLGHNEIGRGIKLRRTHGTSGVVEEGAQAKAREWIDQARLAIEEYSAGGRFHHFVVKREMEETLLYWAS